MMEIKSSLEKIIGSGLRCKNADKGNLSLDDEESNMDVTLASCPENTVSIKLPRGQGDFLKKNKICDYLIIIPQGDKVVDIIFCELKKSGWRNQVREASGQIKSTIPFFRYIQSAVEIHCTSRRDIKIGKLKNLIIFEQISQGLISKDSAFGKPLQRYRHEEGDLKFCVIANAKRIPLGEIDIDDGMSELPQKPRQ